VRPQGKHLRARALAKRSRERGISHSLREGHEQLLRQLKGLTQFWTIDRSPKYGSKPFGGTEQIDVLGR
jgi:hypothetical protein